MFRREVFVVFFLSSFAVSPLRGGEREKKLVNDLLEGLARGVEQTVATAGEVNQPDYSITPSFVVETRDGRLFQLRTLTLLSSGGNLQLLQYLARADSLNFYYQGGSRWSVTVNWASVGSGLLATAAQGYLQEKESTTSADISTITGETLSGALWVLRLSETPIRRIRILRDAPVLAPSISSQQSSFSAPTPPPAPPPAQRLAPQATPIQAPRQEVTPPAAALASPTPLPVRAPDSPRSQQAVPQPTLRTATLPRPDGEPLSGVVFRFEISTAYAELPPGLDLEIGQDVRLIRGGRKVGDGVVTARYGDRCELEVTWIAEGVGVAPGDRVAALP
jgi:hypothetical protein